MKYNIKTTTTSSGIINVPINEPSKMNYINRFLSDPNNKMIEHKITSVDIITMEERTKQVNVDFTLTQYNAIKQILNKSKNPHALNLLNTLNTGIK